MSQWPSIADIVASVTAQKQSAVDLVEQTLATIESHKSYDAIIAVTADRARQRAAQVDADVAAGKPVGRLAGVPFIAKDNFLAYGAETTAASNILKGFEAPYQATAIDKLEAEGAICVAKANMDAFGHGSSTENSDMMTTKNPHDVTKVPGGSSGGSAAAVVLDMVPFATGTDTGGSIRNPASLSGCVGYKPTYGLISRSGVVAMASSTDTVGLLTRTVTDLSLLVDILAGRDPLDSTSIDRDATVYTDLDTTIKGKRVGVIKEWLGEGVDPAVRRTVQAAVQQLADAGAHVEEVSLPSLPLALAVYYIVAPAEISSNLSRYDGQRFGYSDKTATDLQTSYVAARGTGFGAEAKRRIMMGTYVLSSGYYDAFYNRAQIVRTKLIREFTDIFSRVDVLAGPVAPTVAFTIGERTDDPLKMYLEDSMTVAASLVGIPAMSVPAGTAHDLPVGLQLLAPQRHDRQLLGIAKAFEELAA